uniref:Uncharacterized protein n=1 Tax=Timema poppense TaxID=170557 RepID=A0A7R9GX78_TIMPO|nr:unnamed protein product [Timema poppensis]
MNKIFFKKKIGSTLRNTLPKATSTCMVLAAVLGVLATRTAHATFATGKQQLFIRLQALNIFKNLSLNPGGVQN